MRSVYLPRSSSHCLRTNRRQQWSWFFSAAIYWPEKCFFFFPCHICSQPSFYSLRLLRPQMSRPNRCIIHWSKTWALKITAVWINHPALPTQGCSLIFTENEPGKCEGTEAFAQAKNGEKKTHLNLSVSGQLRHENRCKARGETGGGGFGAAAVW